MATLLLLVPLAGACGAAFGFFILGKHRSVFTAFDGDGPVHALAGIAWRALLYPVGLVGVSMLLAGFLGFYPMRPVEGIAVFLASLVCSSIGEKVFRRHNASAARRAGLLSEEDL